MIEIEKQERERDRKRTYISSWCMYETDLDLMWKGYVHQSSGVAIKSTIKKLKDICDNAVGNHPIDISEVKYFDQTSKKHINDFGTPTTFLYKDFHFKLDNEFRIIHYPNFSSETPDHIDLKIDLEKLIEEVVLKPRTEENARLYVLKLLHDVGLEKIPVLASRDDREVIE